MFSDDVYRTRLASVVTRLKQAVGTLQDVAVIDASETDSGARFSLSPKVAGACPLDLMLRSDQHFDIEIGQEFYEDCPIERLDLFEPLIHAIAEGRVIQRHHVSDLTGVPRGLETIVKLPDGEQWQRWHGQDPTLPPWTFGLTTLRDHSFLPYRRS